MIREHQSIWTVVLGLSADRRSRISRGRREMGPREAFQEEGMAWGKARRVRKPGGTEHCRFLAWQTWGSTNESIWGAEDDIRETGRTKRKLLHTAGNFFLSKIAWLGWWWERQKDPIIGNGALKADSGGWDGKQKTMLRWVGIWRQASPRAPGTKPESQPWAASGLF